MNRVWGKIVGCLGLILAAVLVAGPARAGDDLNRELAEVARGIKQLLDGRGQDSVAVGEFTGPARAAASGGAGVKQALIEELKRAGVRVERKAELEVKGDYLDAEDRASGLVGLVLKARVLDRTGTEIAQLQRQLFNVADIAAILGVTVQLPPVADEKARDQAFRKGLDDPHPAIVGDQVRAAPDSPYAIRVLVQQGDRYAAQAPRVEDGLAFVPLKRDAIYAIDLINDSPHDAAVVLSIDGLSVFAFSRVMDPTRGRPKYSHYIVPARSVGRVLGWHNTDSGPESTESFQITEYSKSASAELGGSVGEIGTITASFAAAWPKGSPPPADEPDAAARKSGRSGDATGRGPKIGVEYTPVERDLGRVRATVSVRYNK